MKRGLAHVEFDLTMLFVARARWIIMGEREATRGTIASDGYHAVCTLVHALAVRRAFMFIPYTSHFTFM